MFIYTWTKEFKYFIHITWIYIFIKFISFTQYLHYYLLRWFENITRQYDEDKESS